LTLAKVLGGAVILAGVAMIQLRWSSPVKG
jgi:hypothetical protein